MIFAIQTRAFSRIQTHKNSKNYCHYFYYGNSFSDFFFVQWRYKTYLPALNSRWADVKSCIRCVFIWAFSLFVFGDYRFGYAVAVYNIVLL